LRTQLLKLLGLALVAVFALGVFASATALAEELPNFLPEGTEANPVSFKDHGKGGTLETKAGEKSNVPKRLQVVKSPPKNYKKLGSLEVNKLVKEFEYTLNKEKAVKNRRKSPTRQGRRTKNAY
jgi:hypothetical protein